MSHPPPPPKKRYYYSNGGPNHMMRYGGSFSKKGYTGNGGYGAVPLGGSSAAAPVGAAANEASRPSRYDPNSPSRPVSSRNPGSRYNPEVEIDSQPFAEDSLSKPTGSRYSGSRYNPGHSQQVRPRSMDMAKKDLSHSYPKPGGNGLASTNLNTASGYYSRSNKWRSHSGTNMSAEAFESFGGSMTRPPFWKSQKGKFTTASPTQSGAIKKATPSPTLPSAGRFNRYSGSSSRRESSDESEAVSEKNEPEGRNDNPHSLGSSLINSVVETTRKVEQQHATDHKRIDIDKLTSLRSKESTKGPDEAGIEENVTKPVKEIVKPLRKTTSEMWSSSDTSVKKEKDKEPVREDTEKQPTDEEPIFHKEPSKIYDDYEFIYEPDLLKTNLRQVSRHEPIANYSIPIEPLNKCIFPLSKAETRLWELKNQPREKIVADQRHLLKRPIKSISSYPFIQQNRLIHKQAIRTSLCRKIASIKRYDFLKKLQLKKQFLDLQSIWEKNCEQMDETSRKIRKEELERKKQEELEEQERQMNERRLSERNSRISGSSRRRNRGDFVDDAEIENVLLQIDPDYKHHQQAAEIPPMILNPTERYTFKMKDVNNLVMDKDSWASRILKDGIDTFTENEHELFVEGYLTYPKKFGKISQFMGALRSPEECVLHYYRTKNSVDYKKLLNDKNKKRQKGSTAKRRRKKEKSNEADTGIPVAANDTIEQNAGGNSEPSAVTIDIVRNDVPDEKPFKQMEQVEIRLPEVQDTTIAMVSVPPEKQDTSLEHEEPANNQVDEQALPGNGDVNSTDHKPYPLSPMPEKTEIDASALKKRPHETNEIFSDAEKTILDEQVPQDAVMETNGGQLPRTVDYVDQTTNLPNNDIITDENLQRKRHKSNSDHKSSYWSVKESNLFPELLKQFGSQWSLISEKLGTKSTTMVRNYYQRNAAQLGWKSVVEEADFRRNATSSGSVQQSQILIQAEQNSMQVSNGIPPQQRPALGFFSNQASSEKRLPPDITTTSQSYAPESNRDSFSQALTPVNALPPPRLPSIQLPGTTSAESTEVEGLNKPAASVGDNLLSDQDKTTGAAVSSIMSILNSDDKKQKYVPALALPPSHQVPHFGPLQHNQPTSAIRPNVGKVVVQELQKSSSSSPENRHSSSISSLLNPESQELSSAQPPSNVPNKAFNKSSLPCSPQLPQPPLSQPQQGTFNFAVDPLGALAAIASESLLPTKTRQANENQGNES